MAGLNWRSSRREPETALGIVPDKTWQQLTLVTLRSNPLLKADLRTLLALDIVQTYLGISIYLPTNFAPIGLTSLTFALSDGSRTGLIVLRNSHILQAIANDIKVRP
jgi:hypothetical protein